MTPSNILKIKRYQCCINGFGLVLIPRMFQRKGMVKRLSKHRRTKLILFRNRCLN
jgi:hypothetical protein